MNMNNRWFLLLAVAASATVGAAVATLSRRRHHRTTRELEHKTDVKSWENEGGNVAPIPVAAVLP
jgi:hypothetical protein